MVYLPLPQLSDRLYSTFRAFSSPHFVVRTSGAPAGLTAAFKRAIAEQDATLPLFEIATLNDVLGEAVLPARVNVQLFGLFAAIGLLLATLGLYGVVSYTVAQRTQEIGIRMALGAQGRDVLQLVLRHGFKLALIGTAVGLLAAWGATRWLQNLLFGVGTHDPLTLCSIALLSLAVALLACWVPARRATRVDPMIALRCE
jgi:ABC-type antimicrobial peptide transport system permease subunit